MWHAGSDSEALCIQYMVTVQAMEFIVQGSCVYKL